MLFSKAILFSTSVLVTAASANATLAQTASSTGSPTAVGEVIVTGTRLKLPEYKAPNPVMTITGKTLEARGVTNLTDYLKSIPALTNSVNSENDANAGLRGSVGLNELDLRNLGTNRTLVLVNGLRHVAGDPGTQAVDINSIPASLVDRVEVLTGGVSAIYGADAVSGVVNFIMKENYEGADIRAQAGLATEGAGESQQISGLIGHNFAQGRGNFTVDVEAENTMGVNPTDRSYLNPSNSEALVLNPNPGPNGPTNIFAKNVRYKDSAEGGAVYTNFDNPPNTYSGVSFQGNGQPWVDGVDGGQDFMIGGSGTLLGRYREQVLPPSKRFVIDSTVHFDVTPKIRVFGDFKWSNVQTTLISQPSFNYGIFVPIDNPYIPASVYNDATSNSGLGTAQGAADAGLPGPGVQVGRDNFDLGDVFEDITRNTYRAVVGFKGAATPWLDYQVAYTYGRTDTNDVERNNRIEERFYAAADAVRDPATGNIVCRSSLPKTSPAYGVPYGDPFLGEAPISDFGATFTPGPNDGCVPINIFGAGGISQAAKNWINAETVQTSTIDQQDFSAYISGRSTPLFELPAGPVTYALGGEYRRETSIAHASAIQKQAAADQFNISFLGASVDSGGAFEVAEGYAETNIPLLKDLFLARDLSVGGAYRYSHYTTVGDTHTYEINAEWRPIQSLMFRGTLAHAVRAPDITELFQPLTQTYALFNDPCDMNNVNLGKAPRVANCTADLAPSGQTPSTFSNTSSDAIAGTIGGNSKLKPETAHSFTYGIVLTPSKIPNLSISIDYYNIKIIQAIETFDPQTIADDCVDLPRPNLFCPYITRSPTTGFINGFTQIYINIAGYRTSGFDFTARYRLDPADFGVKQDVGHFDIAVQGTKLEELTFNKDPAAPPEKLLGTNIDNSNQNVNAAPVWQLNLNVSWYIGQFTINYGFDWASRTRRYSIDVQRGDPNYVSPGLFYHSAVSTHDLQVRYDFKSKWAVYVGADNLTDQQPDVGDPQPSAPVSPLGRFIYVGAEAKF